MAAGAFGVAVIAGLLILAPWSFGGPMSATVMVRWVDEQAAPKAAMERDLALRIDRKVEAQQKRAELFQWGLLVIVLALGVEFAALVYQLRSV